MTGTVVLLPAAQVPGTADSDWPERLEIAAELAAYSVPVCLPRNPEPLDLTDPSLDVRAAAAHWVAHNAIELTKAMPTMPLLLAAWGPAGGLVPALGFAQKASRHAVCGYALIDSVSANAAGADWPDAPVDIIVTPQADEVALTAARLAELRGWTCHRDANPAQILRQLMEH